MEQNYEILKKITIGIGVLIYFTITIALKGWALDEILNILQPIQNYHPILKYSLLGGITTILGTISLISLGIYLLPRKKNNPGEYFKYFLIPLICISVLFLNGITINLIYQATNTSSLPFPYTKYYCIGIISDVFAAIPPLIGIML